MIIVKVRLISQILQVQSLKTPLVALLTKRAINRNPFLIKKGNNTLMLSLRIPQMRKTISIT